MRSVRKDDIFHADVAPSFNATSLYQVPVEHVILLQLYVIDGWLFVTGTSSVSSVRTINFEDQDRCHD